MDGERCDTELAPSTPQPAAGAEGVEMFTTPMQQLPVDDVFLPVVQLNRIPSLPCKEGLVQSLRPRPCVHK